MFDNIRPEDFVRETSAVQREPWTERELGIGLHTSDVGFQMLIRSLIAAARASAAAGSFLPTAVLANTDERRFFHGEHDEYPQDFADRLRREAQQMNAHWMWVAMINPARALLPGQSEVPVDGEDLEAIADALQSGQLSMGIVWSAGARKGSSVDYSGGIVYLDGDGKPADEVEGVMVDMDDPFLTILTP